MPGVGRRALITTADDFGLSVGVNEAVEQAATRGILTSASLMVAAPAAADAVARARRLPGLHVGLHLVVIEGPAVLPPARLARLVDAHGLFSGDQFRLGMRYAFDARARAQLAAEIRAQFAAFAATGLVLDHANAHKHMHLHPVVGAMMIRIGHEFGLRAIRIPAEPPLARWCGLLRRQARRAGLRTNDCLRGLGATGHMNQATVRAILAALPLGVTEMYFHPATARDPTLVRTMPEYEHQAELAALLADYGKLPLAAYGDLP